MTQKMPKTQEEFITDAVMDAIERAVQDRTGGISRAAILDAVHAGDNRYRFATVDWARHSIAEKQKAAMEAGFVQAVTEYQPRSLLADLTFPWTRA